MKNVLKKVLSMLLVCSLVFTTNAVVTLADGLNTETTKEIETTTIETTIVETTAGEVQPTTTKTSETSKTLGLNNEIKATKSEVIGKENLFGEGPVWMYYWIHEDMYGVYTLHLSGNPPADDPYYGEINTTGQIEYDSIYADVDPKRGRVNKIVIHDPIFALSCYDMFKVFSKVEKIEGLGYIDTISVTNFTSMFEGCSSLKALDLSDLDTSNAVAMPYMFKGCSKLRTILVGDSFVQPLMPQLSGSMFNNCPKLHGQRGTKCLSGEEYNVNYAHVDGGPTNPGFFTKKGEAWMYWYRVMPYVLHLTSNEPTGEDYEIVTRYDVVEYGSYNELNKADIKKVVFDNEWAAETYAELFCGFTNLEEIEGLDKFKIDKVKSMHAMFKDCKNLNILI